MTSFFARMGERAQGRAPALRVRPPQPFEGARPARLPIGVGDTSSGAVDEILDIVGTALDGAPRRPVRRPAGQRAAQNSAGSPVGQDVAARAAPSERPTPVSLAEPPTASELEQPLARPRPERGRERTAPRPTSPPPRPTPERETSSADPEPSAPPRRPTQPVREAVPPRLTRQTPRDRARPDVPEPSAVDLADLMRTHVLPALVARGLVSSRDPVDLVTEAPQRPGDDGTTPPARARRAGAPRSGTVTVTASPARQAAGGPAAPTPAGNPDARRRAAATVSEPSTPSGPLQVHVHIDRVVVARPAPAARPVEPAPAQRPRPQADHDAYLARRRESR